MGQHILPGNPPIEVTLRRSAQARRISLRVSALDGRVTLTLPKGLAEREALDFARSKREWLAGHLADRAPEVIVAPGASIPVEGQMLRIEEGRGRRVTCAEGSLQVPGGDAARLQAWLKTLARDRLAAASDRYAAELGRRYARITLRDTRSRWGSCSSSGGLRYSWRLIMAPAGVLDYVAAHEVAHLEQMNHSPAYWAIVARLMPDYQSHRKWLRQSGTALHRYRFD
ncbi:M48 family peptidase [Pelagivirga sediminicola]|uniref:M48 family peptidase n=1 Tax=Pelagivirga sediminicola TaxID=2170575 RepID=A0A2T7G8V7_9RHOB|nr:SprT family zinc-dependent metalloprotease [Pelagivirga sediminicola]PVA10831.1 M48 family peptidase [Pelagivirga sediminicola]